MAKTIDINNLDEFIDVDLFLEEVNEDPDDLSEAMRKITGRAAWYSIQARRAAKQAADIETYVKNVEAVFRAQHRKALTDAAIELAAEEGGKPERVTQEMVNSALYSDQRMIRMLNVQTEAELIKGVCMDASAAFRRRTDMLKGMSHLAVEEMRNSKTLVTRSQEMNSVAEYRARRAQRGGGAIPGEEANDEAE